MPEMILPGTYIEVRAEGLIAAGAISVSNVGIVGTAQRGKLGNPSDPDLAPTVYTPANISEAREIFGAPDPFDSPIEASELTLVRALELAFANGAQRVFAVRVAAAGSAPSVYTLPAASGDVVVESIAAGAGYDDATITVAAGSAANLRNVTFELGRITESWRDVPADAAAFADVINGGDLDYRYSSLSSTGGGSNLFSLNASGATGALIVGPGASSALGSNGAEATAADYKAGLDALANQDVHIVVLAGQSGNTAAGDLISHCENASTDMMRRERIGVIGSPPLGTGTITPTMVTQQDEGRLIFVGPGLRATDTASGRLVTLSGGYAAAAVAGRIASLDAHISPTNKTINAAGLERVFNGTQLSQLVLNRVLALESRNGAIRIVKGITTAETSSAWTQITTRRIVDYARFGVRSACNPYIGKLNNDRVRQAMKSTINGFLADMVDQEMLISYELDVSATREQQIRGIAVVTMTLRPTFSIDFIRVIMNLE